MDSNYTRESIARDAKLVYRYIMRPSLALHDIDIYDVCNAMHNLHGWIASHSDIDWDAEEIEYGEVQMEALKLYSRWADSETED